MKPNIFVVGYQPQPGIPMEDYTDFGINMKFNWLEIEEMVNQGVLPPGIILQAMGGKPCVIVGKYGTQQEVNVLAPKET